VRLGGVDCAATYLHEPGDAKDGLTVSVPLFVLNQVSEERCEWLVTGMLKDKIQALLKSLPQRRARGWCRCPSRRREAGRGAVGARAVRRGLADRRAAQAVRDATSIDVKRADFKLDMLPPHLFMNLRVVDEHGRQLGMGRNLGALKAELGAQARGAFQALAGLNVKASPAPKGEAAAKAGAREERGARKSHARLARRPALHGLDLRRTAGADGSARGAQSLIGFPALIDEGDAVTIEVFDEPAVAAAKHRAGLRRLFALQLKDALKYLEKNIPDLQKMAVAYMPLGTSEELRAQIIDVALDRAFLQEPLPTDEFASSAAGRGPRPAHADRQRGGAAGVDHPRRVRRRRAQDQGHEDPARGTCRTPRSSCSAGAASASSPPRRGRSCSTFARYLKAIVLRLDKLRADPARDTAKLAELRPQEQRYWRLVAERKGVVDERMLEFRWLLEELRVSFFAQELRTPQPVSVKRLDKAWAQLQA
jgi:ATP-dependent helicase HrpA